MQQNQDIIQEGIIVRPPLLPYNPHYHQQTAISLAQHQSLNLSQS